VRGPLKRIFLSKFKNGTLGGCNTTLRDTAKTPRVLKRKRSEKRKKKEGELRKVKEVPTILPPIIPKNPGLRDKRDVEVQGTKKTEKVVIALKGKCNMGTEEIKQSRRCQLRNCDWDQTENPQHRGAVAPFSMGSAHKKLQKNHDAQCN